MRLAEDSEFAGYRIIRMLGEGGMGSVYLAKHPRLPREDALKLLSGVHASNAEFRGRFEREADVAAGLRHPNIVSVYDRGAEGDQLWIAMQYVEGVDAAELVAAGPKVLTPERALVIIGDVAKALDHAHRNGVLHRDVKPANILVTGAVDHDADGAEESALLTDFGIARAVQSAAEGLTMPGFMVGTTAYAAPEMLSGRTVDHRIDIYALACTLYEMLTGRPPFQRDSVPALMTAHLTAPPPVPSQVRAGLPQALDRVMAKGLAKDPNQRYRTCRELYHDAARALGSASMPSGPQPYSRPQTPPFSSPQFSSPQYSTPQPYAGPPPISQPPRPPHFPGPPQPNQGGRSTALIGVAVAVVALLVIGAVVLVVSLSGSDSNTSSSTSSSQTSEDSTSEESSSDESTPEMPAEPTAESDDGAFVVSIPDGWNDSSPDDLLQLISDTGAGTILVSLNPGQFQGADVTESAEIGSQQIVDELKGRIDPSGIQSATVGDEPAATFTYSLLAVDGQVGVDVRGTQYFVRRNDFEYIVTFSSTVDTFNADAEYFEYTLDSWTWLD